MDLIKILYSQLSIDGKVWLPCYSLPLQHTMDRGFCEVCGLGPYFKRSNDCHMLMLLTKTQLGTDRTCLADPESILMKRVEGLTLLCYVESKLYD